MRRITRILAPAALVRGATQLRGGSKIRRPPIPARWVNGAERLFSTPTPHQHATQVSLDWWYPSDDGKLLA